jgi:hypothetical protein
VLVVDQRPFRGRFLLFWNPRSPGPATVRVTVRDGGRDLVSSAPEHTLVGSPPQLCAAATPPSSVPAGDGWVTGGLYTVGGPAPGIDNCSQSPFTVTVLDQNGGQVATQSVPGGQSYTIVLAAGTYTLQSNSFCRGMATVVAGQGTMANTNCDVP